MRTPTALMNSENKNPSSNLNRSCLASIAVRCHRRALQAGRHLFGLGPQTRHFGLCLLRNRCRGGISRWNGTLGEVLAHRLRSFNVGAGGSQALFQKEHPPLLLLALFAKPNIVDNREGPFDEDGDHEQAGEQIRGLGQNVGLEANAFRLAPGSDHENGDTQNAD